MLCSVLKRYLAYCPPWRLHHSVWTSLDTSQFRGPMKLWCYLWETLPDEIIVKCVYDDSLTHTHMDLIFVSYEWYILQQNKCPKSFITDFALKLSLCICKLFREYLPGLCVFLWSTRGLRANDTVKMQRNGLDVKFAISLRVLHKQRPCSSFIIPIITRKSFIIDIFT